MKYKKQSIAVVLLVSTVTSTLVGCTGGNTTKVQVIEQTQLKEEVNPTQGLDFKFHVVPERFELQVEVDGVVENVSLPIGDMKVSNLQQSDTKVSWMYKEQGIGIEIEKQKDYLDVTISSTKDENTFSWPIVTGEQYILPLQEGKRIPSDDPLWKEYLGDTEIKGIEGLSMQFFAVDKKDYSLVYMIKNPYNNTITFDTEADIELKFNHEYPSINEEKSYGFRIYVAEKDPVDVAKLYRNYMIEEGKFKTLAEKAKTNPNIEKLYGAPHVYFWEKSIMSYEDIKWEKLKNGIDKPLKKWMEQLLREQVEDGEELAKVFDDMELQDYVDKYTKNRVIKAFTSLVQLENFYNPQVFTQVDEVAQGLLEKGIDNLDEVELINLNKHLLKGALGDKVAPLEHWADASTIEVLEDMKASGIDRLWIGLDDWQNGFIHPKFVEIANQMGYLIGTYDSYHSIHKPGEEKWITAKFEDTSLYENATVTRKDGEKIQGFQGEGRKLNPALAMDSVKERVSSILDTGILFNSWFLDTDGTGEVFDDYSPDHITTEAQDIAARMERVTYLQDEWGMVVGTEGGNDFANPYVAFAHGIETPSFSWMDKDMSKNKDSEYYVGRYYSATNGVPEMFAKEIPLKERYKKLFLDPTYNIPLYKLVYNDSVITTHWWGWGTLKLEELVEDRMLYEVLYNVPPLYHLDRNEWEKHKEAIVKHSNRWSQFSKQVINEEMTDFQVLSEDRLVQMTTYGDEIKVIANFSNEQVEAKGYTIAAKSLIIIQGSEVISYTP